MAEDRSIRGRKGEFKGTKPKPKSPITQLEFLRKDSLQTDNELQEEADMAIIAYDAYANRFGSPLPPLPGEGEPVKVIFVRGLPASGKTTWAKAVQEHYPAGSVVRINNDEIASSLFGSTNTAQVQGIGSTLALMRNASLEAALSNPQVRIVIFDNTNLHVQGIRGHSQVAESRGGEVEVNDDFLRTPLETCLERNSKREDPVPENVIQRMHKQSKDLKPWVQHPKVKEIRPYRNDPNLPHSVVVDVDGTLANMSPDRSPYDFTKVGQDLPNTPVVNMVKSLRAEGKEIIILSGRSDECREETQKWLDKHVGKGLPLHMRKAGDNRPDWLVKYELFQSHLEDQYHIECVIDDRDQVVHLWRRQLKVPTFQVADGNF